MLAVAYAIGLILAHRFSILVDLIDSPVTPGSAAARGLVILLALAAGYTLGTRSERRPWFWCGCLVILPILALFLVGHQFRGSSRWIRLGGIGFVAVNEWIAALWSIVFARMAWREDDTSVRPLAIATLFALGCITIGSRAFAILIMITSAIIVARQLRGRTTRLLFLGFPAVAGLAVLAYGGTSGRLMRFVADFGRSSFHTAQLRRLLTHVTALPGDDAFVGIQVPHLVQDCSFALDLCAGGWILACLAYGGVLYFLARYAFGVPAGEAKKISPARVLAAFALGKGLIHILSCLTLIPAAGLPFPFLSLTGSDGVVLALILGCQAGVSYRR